MTATAAQLRDRPRLKPALLAEITLLNSGPTLYLTDRTLPGAISGQLYDHYIESIDGLTEEVKRNDSTFLNSRITINFLNGKYGAYNYLVEAFDTYPIEGAAITIKEVLIDDDGSMATPVTIFKGYLDEPDPIDIMKFTCKVSSRLYAKSRLFRQKIVDKLIYPNADPNDIGKYLNIVYGSIDRIKCHAVRAGAQDKLPDNIFAGSPAAAGTWTLTDASNFPASGAFTVQVDDEQIRITSRSGNTLTVASRGFGNTTADDHSRGATVYEVRTEYVYIAAGHPVKAIDACYVDGVKQTTGVTFYTGQTGSEHADFPGMAVVTFASRPKVIKTGSVVLNNPEHGHAPVGGSTTTTTESATNLPQVTVDNAGTLGIINSENINFPVHANIVAASYTITFTMAASGYKWLIKLGDQIVDSYNKSTGGGSMVKSSPITLSYMTNTAYLPVRVEAYGDPYSAQTTDAQINITAASRTVTYTTTATIEPNTQDSLLSGRASADTVIGQSINVDIRGYQDTAGGTYTGTGNALIERPDHVFKHALIAQLGYASGDLDSTSFTASGTSFSSAISGGYKFGICIIDKLDWPRFLQQMGYESRSNIYERAGVWYLKYLPDTAPAALKTISSAELAEQYGKFTFSRSPIIDLKTMLDAKFKWNFDKMEGRFSDWLGTSSTYKSAGTADVSATLIDGGYVITTTTETVTEHINGATFNSTIAVNGAFTSYVDYVLNGSFSATNTKVTNGALTATNMVTNGSFATSASWTYGTGWFFEGSLKARKGIDGAGALEQDFGTVIGKSYTVIFTVSSRTAGDVTVSIGGQTGTARSTNATFTETFTATSTASLKFTPSNTARLYIDDVAVYENSWVMGAGWNATATTIKKDAAGTGTLSQVFTVVAGRDYTVTFTLSSSSSTSITPSIGGTNGTARTSNGTYTEVIRATNTGPLTFTPTDATRTTIDDIQVSDAWTYGTGWTTAGTYAAHAVGTASSVSQDFTTVIGKSYTVTYTVSNMSGTGGITASLGGVTGTQRTANGTYVETFTATTTAELSFTADAAFGCRIDTVTATLCSWEMGTGWNYNSAKIRKDVDGTGVLTQAMTVVAGKKYCVIFTISNYSIGSVTASIGGTNGTARSANGTYLEIITATDTTALKFTPSNTARFYLDEVIVDPYWLPGTGWSKVKNSLNNGNSIAVRVIISYADGIDDTVRVSYGGDNSPTYDTAGTYYVVLTATSDGPGFGSTVVSAPSWSYTILSSNAIQHTTGTEAFEQELTLIAGREYTVTFSVAGWPSGGGIYFTLGGVTGTPVASNGTFTQTITAIDTATSLKFYSLESATDIGIYSVSVTSSIVVTEEEVVGGGGTGGTAGALGTETPPASIYGDYYGEVQFKYIREQAMADHVLDHILLEGNTQLLGCRFPIFWEHFDLGVGDTFDISNALYNARKFYIEKFRRIDQFRAEVQALEWW